MAVLRKRDKKVAWGVVLALALASVFRAGGAGAQVSFGELNAVPACIGGVQTQNCAYGQAELPPAEAVAAEVRHLETVLPAVAALDISVYTVRQRCSLPSLGMLAGCTLPGQNKVYLFASPRYASYTVGVRKGEANVERFAPYLAAYAVAHEFGHVVRYQLVDDRTLQEYLKLRGAAEAGGDRWTCHPEEIFAEDFRWLFGSEKARHIPYLCGIAPPGEKEKAFLLEVLAGE
jgi:hypothetical protein